MYINLFTTVQLTPVQTQTLVEVHVSTVVEVHVSTGRFAAVGVLMCRILHAWNQWVFGHSLGLTLQRQLAQRVCTCFHRQVVRLNIDYLHHLADGVLISRSAGPFSLETKSDRATLSFLNVDCVCCVSTFVHGRCGCCAFKPYDTRQDNIYADITEHSAR